ncbi:bifunctional helix-turn-helix domain-containing protein/methylated-DNA--[protein]-cysteine S-methyltransferase [Dethiosulfatarculus sandiegensis]|uniref:methylated-DNA--[protein]-cysteine S-methyltransferase n=1 Tax=Dethiosulfatarculus sandiegensis TaxID=1429043 RepID=A0A0D2K0N8_9BACT|nr:methylated-DNA--[protein]-cysteine S-methyltransferase [Dethiosulfatarculus sandiegensis]KIX15300.1 methylated-DNA--protein-cysteine methyltransferase [Dethiosulfatarculus sandiegensis]
MNNREYILRTDDYRVVEQAIRFMEDNFRSQPTLEDMAKNLGQDKYQFIRLFKRWAGVTPLKFQQFLTLDYTKAKLLESKSLLSASLQAGLSGPSRLHDLFVNFEAVTPGEFKNKGAGLEISYGISDSPFGPCLQALTKRGICHLAFMSSSNEQELLAGLKNSWPGAKFVRDDHKAGEIAKTIFTLPAKRPDKPFNLLLKGTNFQIKVWQALLNIPSGFMVTYQDVAVWLGKPKAFRAVANAVAMNPVAYLIPCHRVIAKSGKIHKYRWGSQRKKALVGWEAAQSSQEQ